MAIYYKKNKGNYHNILDILVVKWLSLDKNTNNIINIAQNMISIEHAISIFIPKNLKISYKLIKFENNILSIAVPNSENATRIRYFSTDIIKNIQSKFHLKIDTIKIKIYSNCFVTHKPLAKNSAKCFLNEHSLNNFKKLQNKIQEGPLKESISNLIKKNSTFIRT
ncbi:DciA family protein [Candidatus Kinetoplastidibacterium crithidiae]|uniref:DUF721 domain-containing protein n=1 Tax=Candidatus Kinetoplastidibacterium crithidiae TCC036E TaxID=1208918 RepID=M1L5D4_9PROT|nr:DciA family protein [Candidatus Kinetoplastibacterium crithidii]AFZ82491.1 hypothetical protein CKCE_0046 [Candidatus Kinetoplastibacterium crithidii (ex Angomonas deanei ATCC 30255)]AGF47848.1 hypothetical protein CDEE_0889 [Candidatus Kinetoplastibacterium crithidii TCC036E]